MSLALSSCLCCRLNFSFCRRRCISQGIDRGGKWGSRSLQAGTDVRPLSCLSLPPLQGVSSQHGCDRASSATDSFHQQDIRYDRHHREGEWDLSNLKIRFINLYFLMKTLWVDQTHVCFLKYCSSLPCQILPLPSQAPALPACPTFYLTLYPLTLASHHLTPAYSSQVCPT